MAFTLNFDGSVHQEKKDKELVLFYLLVKTILTVNY